MTGRRLALQLAAALLALAIYGCGAAASTPTPTLDFADTMATTRAEALETMAAGRTLTALIPTRTPGPTFTPSITPTPTVTPSPTATALLTPLPPSGGPLTMEGPALIFRTYLEGVQDRATWVMSADGTTITSLDEVGEFFEPSPVGSLNYNIHLAYVNLAYVASGTSSLRIMTLPSREVETITEFAAGGDSYTRRVAVERGGLVWSHNGRQLAFVSDLDGSSFDLYVYSLDTNQLRRITTTPDRETSMEWSPDDSYIVYGSGDPYQELFDHYVEMWSAPANSDGSPLRLHEAGRYSRVMGWIDNSTIALHEFGLEWGSEESIQQVNVATGQTAVVRRGLFIGTAFDPDSNVWAFTESYDDCSTGGGQLVMLTRGGELTTTLDGCGSVYWLDNAGIFLNYAEPLTGQATVRTPDGLISTTFTVPFARTVIPRISPNGQYWAWIFVCTEGCSGEPGLWISEGDTNPRLIYSRWVSKTIWSFDSRTLYFAGEGGIYMASAPDFEPVLVVDIDDHTTYPVFENARWIP